MEWPLLTLRSPLLPALFLLAAVATGHASHVSAEPDDPPPPAPVVKPHTPFAIPPTPIRPAAHYRALEERVKLLAGLHECLPGPDPSTNSLAEGKTPEPSDVAAAVAAFQLIQAGPDSIPVLLAHLDDETPTPRSLEHLDGYGGMEARTWIDVNPALAEEVAALHETYPGRDVLDPDTPDRLPSRWIDRHTIRVGDVCFALLGAIVNRDYDPIEGRGTNITVITSPTQDPRVARVVRAQWAGKNARAELARRLLADFHTTLGGDWRTRDGSRQARAAGLLVRYFPQEAIPLVVARIDGLVLDDAVHGDELDKASGLDVRRLVSECGTCRDPRVQKALLRAALRAESSDVFREALRALPESQEESLRIHTLAMLREESRRARGESSWAVQDLLGAVGRRWPEAYEGALRLRLADGLGGMRDVAELAYEAKQPLPLHADVWVALLARGEKVLTSEGGRRLHRLRVCDVAALQLVRLKPALDFDEAGGESARDAQISALRKALATGDK